MLRTLFGGPVQPEHLDPNGGIFVANQDGAKPGTYNPDQYSNIEVRLFLSISRPALSHLVRTIKPTCVGPGLRFILNFLEFRCLPPPLELLVNRILEMLQFVLIGL
jgi:hypothetical protein